MHKDQKNVQEAVLPHIIARVVEDSPEAERDCTILNRVLNQGPDPLTLMELCPDQFFKLCRCLGMTVEEGRAAIETAHERGPAAIMAPDGGFPIPVLPEILDWGKMILRERPSFEKLDIWNPEILWLVLAGFSDCTEDGYKKDITLTERLQRTVGACTKLAEFASSEYFTGESSIVEEAQDNLKMYLNQTVFTPGFNNIPTTDKDIGFYVAYKKGYVCVAIVSPSGNTFYGTIPTTTLKEQGVVVDKEISPCYGIVFKKE